MSNELSIIIYSCWKNRDMWKIFSTLFHHYWPDCNYQVVLVTDEYHKTDDTYAFTKVVEKDDTWARMIKNAIKEANTPYVMLFMDDYLLCDAVKNEDIEKHLNRAKKYHAGNYRLIESPKCLGIYNGMEEIGYYELGKAYSLTTQPGIWDCKFLCDLMEDHYSAWDFERIASVKSGDFNQPVLTSLDYEFPYEEGVRKGKWMKEGAKLCRRNGIKIDETVRPIMTNKEMAKIYFQGAIIDWNPTLVVKVQNFLNRKIHKK